MRWIIRIISTLVILVVVGLAGILLIPSERIARIAEAEFEKNTGRQLSITGGVQPKLFPRLGVSLAGAQISNADWSDQGPLLVADAIEVGVGLGPLIGGEVVVEAFRIENPTIRLEQSEDGRQNWQFLSEIGSDTPGGQTDLSAVSIPTAEILGGTLSFVDRQSGLTQTVSEIDAMLNAADLRGQVDIAMTAQTQGQVISLDGTLSGVEQLLNGGLQPVDLMLEIGGSVIGFSGEAAMDPVQAKGQATVDLADLPALFEVIGQVPPRIPQGLGQRTQVAAALILTPQNMVFLRDAVIQLDQNRFTGDLDIDLTGDKPLVKAKIAGGQIDFSAMSTDTSEGDGAANAGSGGWSEAFLDVSGIDAVNGAFSLDVEGLDLGSIQLGKTSLSGQLDRSRLVLGLNQVSVFDGRVSGQFVVNNRSGLSVGGDLSASDVEMQRLLADFAGFDRLQGRATMALNFLASGSTMNALMNSLSGTGQLNVGSGELLGLDIAGMIKNLDASYQGEGSKTVFDRISASFDIENGILRNDDLDFEAQLLTASGAGQLGIGPQTIAYRIEPVALAEQLASGIRVPILIEGPWSNIRYRPDLAALVDTELEAQKEALKAQARAKEDELKAKARDKLGLTQDPENPGTSLEDQLKARAKNKLLDLLGGD
ncbi:MAG: AsmA family protein [Pseudomonadota bacterium]